MGLDYDVLTNNDRKAQGGSGAGVLKSSGGRCFGETEKQFEERVRREEGELERELEGVIDRSSLGLSASCGKQQTKLLPFPTVDTSKSAVALDSTTKSLATVSPGPTLNLLRRFNGLNVN